MIIADISIAPYVIDKGEFTALYKFSKNVYNRTVTIVII